MNQKTKLKNLTEKLNLHDIGLLTEAMKVCSKRVRYTPEQLERIKIIKEMIKRD